MKSKNIILTTDASKYLRIVCFLLFGICLWQIFYQPLECEDGWWHLSAGRWIVEHRQIMHEDPFLVGGTASPWIYTQWLAGVLFYAVGKMAGIQGLIVFRTLVFLGALAFFIKKAAFRLPVFIITFLVYIMAVGLADRVFLRPFIFNVIFIQLFLYHCFRYLDSNDVRHLVVLPLWGILLIIGDSALLFPIIRRIRNRALSLII